MRHTALDAVTASAAGGLRRPTRAPRPPAFRRWGATLAMLAACDAAPAFERAPAPAGRGADGYAHACVTVEAYDGAETVRSLARSAAGYAFSAITAASAERFHLRATDLGSYLLYDRERQFVVAEPVAADSAAADAGAHLDAAAASWRLGRHGKLVDTLDVLDEAFRSPAEWRLQPSPRDPKRYQLQHDASGRYLAVDGLTTDAAAAAVITLHPAEGCADFPELGLDADGRPAAKSWPDGDLWGIAEIHSHLFSDAAFGGGGLFHGAPFHRLGVEHALPDCSRAHGPDGKRDLMGFFYDGDVDFKLAELVPVALNGQFDSFNHATDGYPTFSQWPNARKRSTHQVMYYRWIERAYLAGLRLVVQHATGNSVMCDLTVATGAQKSLYSCNDMVSVDRAIDRAYQLERYIDAQSGGQGKGWLRVVTSPQQARAVIADGKLALVLGIEISNLFDCFLTQPPGFPACDAAALAQKLDHYRDRGVRVVFPVHKYDNAFSAGDGSGGVIELGNLINSGHDSSFVKDCPDISAAFDGGPVTFGGINKPRAVYSSPPPHDVSGFSKDVLAALAPLVGDLQAGELAGDWCQQHGLTPLGEELLHGLMRRGMVPDVAHLPRRALQQAYALLEAADYPALKTHGDSNGGRIYALGGLTGSHIGRCDAGATPRALIQPLLAQVAEATTKGAYPAEALGFDFNGFAGGPGPRFGPDAGCPTPQTHPTVYPFTSVDGQVTFQPPMLGTRKLDYDHEGMIHVGLLPELIDDARRDGATAADLEPLFRSAEAYVRMWERAEARAVALGR